MIHAKLVSFTEKGAGTLSRIAGALSGLHVERYARTVDPSLSGTLLARFAQQAMADCDCIVFVGAAGIAVRAVAPYLQGKAFDPAVVVVDEAGRFVVPILSGHLGGANALAQRIADGIGAAVVITTATDGRGVFAVDTWARDHNCAVLDPENIRHVSGALLRGETVGLKTDFPVDGLLPARVSLNGAAEAGFYIGYDKSTKPYTHTLHLTPRIVHLGIGCRRGTPMEKIEAAVRETLKKADIPLDAVCKAASIDRKQDEAGLLLFCEKYHLPLVVFPADALERAEGEFTPSGFVRRTVGVDNVCERSAVCASAGGRLLCRKTALDGVTAALAEQNWRVAF